MTDEEIDRAFKKLMPNWEVKHIVRKQINFNVYLKRKSDGFYIRIEDAYEMLKDENG